MFWLEDILDAMMGVVVSLFTLLMTALVLWLIVMGVFAFRADRACLAEGYPKSRVTYAFETYCMNLEGSVTVKVDRK